ncbi:folylpolyglutamate synthase/dihydrofolate synthase family protein [Pelosinus sp. IPA-1]|uniref:bifunctional folylpolyglutamate synthase/dihydrofolate synthase n=1 Tax=Pelosinus sp. IPA-1 TaxID=3029569 RepID=UPI00243621B8|nr:folylpolyglutamate synthase/dihydrofolate synthase family protein [Pelosinus sp. IPA-1]GMB01798.1 bifunctional folylpolyglutamate synthase/dihydrofolate synthase [Pelosinus sp. IPA-1]
MTYEESLSYLANLNKFGINLGLARIEKLLELMDHPEKKFKSIHVAGTNGKGSTTAMLASILNNGGIKTGMYTSPHLAEYTERMIVDGQEASPEEFAQAIAYTSQFVDRIVLQGFDHPTEFEVLTAAAFYYFASCEVEYAVIEVGLGGLLDSTNVIMPILSVITNVTLDHIDKCGSTIEEIAHHKSGIIKQGVPVVTAAKGQALEVIIKTAQEKSTACYVNGQDFSGTFLGMEEHYQKVGVKLKEQEEIGNFAVNLLGAHQVDNCAVAVMTAVILGKSEKRIDLPAIEKGLCQVCWPGRFEIVSKSPTIIIDGAHNPDGARALRENLDQFYGHKEIVFLLGILQDKDVKTIVTTLICPEDKVVVVAPISQRAGKPEDVAREIQAAYIEVAHSINEGLQKAKLLAGEGNVICIAGSLYLIGEARKIICK